MLGHKALGGPYSWRGELARVRARTHHLKRSRQRIMLGFRLALFGRKLLLFRLHLLLRKLFGAQLLYILRGKHLQQERLFGRHFPRVESRRALPRFFRRRRYTIVDFWKSLLNFAGTHKPPLEFSMQLHAAIILFSIISAPQKTPYPLSGHL